MKIPEHQKSLLRVASRSLSVRETRRFLTQQLEIPPRPHKAKTKHADIGLLVTFYHESHHRRQEVPKLLKAQTQVCGLPVDWVAMV